MSDQRVPDLNECVRQIESLLHEYGTITVDAAAPRIADIVQKARSYLDRAKWPRLTSEYLDNIELLEMISTKLDAANGRTPNPSVADYVKVMVFSLAVIHAETGSQEAAETFFKWSLALDPAYHQAYNRMGDLLASREHYREAIPWYKTAMRSCLTKPTTGTDKPHEYYLGDNCMGVSHAMLKSGDRSSARAFAGLSKTLAGPNYCFAQNFGYPTWIAYEAAIGQT